MGKTRVRNVIALAMSLAVVVGPCPAVAQPVDSKWTIENILSAKDIEIPVDSFILRQIKSVGCDRQLAEVALEQGDPEGAIGLIDSCIGIWKKYLKADDPRIQSARLALSEAELKNRSKNACLSNLRIVLHQQIVVDRRAEAKIRRKLSDSERQEKGVESELQFEKRYARLTKMVDADPAAAAIHRAQLLFWENRLQDALRLTRISLSLGDDVAHGASTSAKVPDSVEISAGSATASGAGVGESSQTTSSDLSEADGPIDSKPDGLFLQSMIYYALGKRALLLDVNRQLGEIKPEGEVNIKNWEARIDMVSGLLKDLDGNHSEAAKLYDTAASTTRKNEDRYDTLLFRAYLGNSLMQAGDPPAAYRQLNRVYEVARRLVEGREKGLLYQGMAHSCLEGMYDCLLVRMSYEVGAQDVFAINGKPVSCSPALEKTALPQRPFTEDNEALAEALYHVGYQHKSTGKQRRAQKLFLFSAYIYDKYFPEKRQQLATTLYDLAESYFWSEMYDVSIATFLKCAQIRREVDPESTDYIMTLNTLGRVYLSNGDAVEAVDSIKSALHRLLHRETMQATRVSRIVSNINRNRKRDPEESETAAIRAPKVVASGDLFLEQMCAMPLPAQLNAVADSRRRSDPDKYPQIDDLWQALADSYSRNKSYDQAAEVSKSLLKLRKDSRKASQSDILSSLWQLAYICGVSNRLEEANKYYSEMIDEHRDRAGRHLAGWYYARGIVVDSLGHAEKAASDFRKAIAEYKKYLKTLDKVEDKENYEHTQWMIADLDQELKAKARCPASSPDYLNGYETCHWGLNRFPLKVYIDNSKERGFGPKLYEYMKKAVDEWAETPGLDNKIQFVDDREKADIYFERMSNYDLIPFGSGGGATASWVQNGKKSTKEIDRVHLRLYCREPDLDKLSNHAVQQLYTLALHEFGHGLGLGHSPSGLDVMYWKSAMSTLSSRDRSTLQKIYGFKVESPDR